MTDKTEFQSVFRCLRNTLLPYAKKLVLKNDKADDFYVNTKFIMKNKKPMYFGSVKINRNYVTFHLMPVYISPKLVKNMSPELRRRMQGKSCFNFNSIDIILFKELTELAKKRYIQYKNSGYL